MNNIIADENMPALALFQKYGRVTTKAGRHLTRADLGDADILLVRSITQVNEALLAGSKVRFVGSATIGTDHVDREWLKNQGIQFAHAPGCNAIAVAEYVLQAVLSWLVENNRAPENTTLAVVGVGNVGSKVAEYCAALGLTVLQVDPFLAVEHPERTWHSLSEALSADIITLHVPLTKTGLHPTYHLLNEENIGQLTPQQLLINSSRGPVIDNAALTDALTHGRGPITVLDVWEHEPQVAPALFALVKRGTPHIAGYSVEGKWRGTWMLFQAWQQWRGDTSTQTAMPQLAPERVWTKPVQQLEDVLELLRSQYRIEDDHEQLQKSLSQINPAQAFDRLRREYGQRYEMSGITCKAKVDARWMPLLTQLGVLLDD